MFNDDFEKMCTELSMLAINDRILCELSLNRTSKAWTPLMTRFLSIPKYTWQWQFTRTPFSMVFCRNSYHGRRFMFCSIWAASWYLFCCFRRFSEHIFNIEHWELHFLTNFFVFSQKHLLFRMISNQMINFYLELHLSHKTLWFCSGKPNF